jgi:bacillithiol system protein YtxJ
MERKQNSAHSSIPRILILTIPSKQPVTNHEPTFFSMTWHPLTDLAQLETLRAESFQQPILIYKHSTSCSISATALNRLERSWNAHEMTHLKAYQLDLLRYRPVSNAVAEQFEVAHESPQVLILRDGVCVYHASHFGISYPAVKAQVA